MLELIKKIFAIITFKAKGIRVNPELAAKIAIEQGKKRLVGFFDALVGLEDNIDESDIAIAEVDGKIKVRESLMEASRVSGNREDVKNTLIIIKDLQDELRVLESDKARSKALAIKLKEQHNKAKREVERAQRNMSSMKARAKSLEIQRELLQTGKALVEGSDGMFSINSLKDEVEKQEKIMGIEDNLAVELGYMETSIDDEELDAEVDAIMNAS